MLTNSAKISDTTKRELLELTYFQGDQKKKKNSAMQNYAVFWRL